MTINLKNLMQPATKVRVFAPNDSADLPLTCSALIVSAAGDIRITDASGTTSTMAAVPVGVLPIAAVRVFATSTTATVTTALGH